MQTAIKSRIVKIGNSQGVRIPKVMLEQLGFEIDVEIAVEAGRLVIRPLTHPRHGWDAHFQAMAGAGDDQLLDAEAAIPSSWDAEEWTW